MLSESRPRLPLRTNRFHLELYLAPRWGRGGKSGYCSAVLPPAETFGNVSERTAHRTRFGGGNRSSTPPLALSETLSQTHESLGALYSISGRRADRFRGPRHAQGQRLSREPPKPGTPVFFGNFGAPTEHKRHKWSSVHYRVAVLHRGTLDPIGRSIMSIRASAQRVIVTMDREVLAWLDEQGFKRERERSWIVQRALLRWQRALDMERDRRRRRRAPPPVPSRKE
jgi:hypothetical protein